jgi:hypothetical protein
MKPLESPRPDRADRRRAERHSSEQNAACHPASRLDVTVVRVKDVSRNGIGLISPRRFEIGTLLMVDLPETASYPVSALARVVRLVSEPEGNWLAGCAFLTELGEEELAAFLSYPKLHQDGDRRVEVRHAVQRTAVCRRSGIGTLGTWPAEVCDISAEGIALLVSLPVEVGARLQVLIAADEEQKARIETVSVVRIEVQPDGRSLLGCELIPSSHNVSAKVVAARA